MLTLLLPACSGSSVDSATCGKSLDSYHRALVASSDSLTSAEEETYQHAVVADCNKATFEALLTGKGYDYTTGPGTIAFGDPDAVFAAFCVGAPKPNHCY